ncbi:MAG: hypothetical protein WDO71_02095 [Bacteroidota bacterium]
MILALLWLTVSTPFVFASKQEQARQDKMANAGTPLNGNEEEAAIPLATLLKKKPPLAAVPFPKNTCMIIT